VGTVVRTWTATDCTGNSVSATSTVTFVDTTAPTLALPPDVTLGCYADTSPANTGSATASDNCDADPTVAWADVVSGDQDACPVDFSITRTWTATDCSGNVSSGTQTITVDCPCGMVELTKYTQGVLNDEINPESMPWSFTLEGPGIDGQLTDSSPPSLVDFGGVNLWPDNGSLTYEYTLCETGIFAGWTLAWSGAPNPDATTPGGLTADTLIPQVFMVNDDPVVNPPGYSNIYDPNYVAPPDTFVNDTRCVNFIVLPGETEAFSIDNQFPGGEPRTIGYWKNWNSCTGGGQFDTAASLGGREAGVFTLDDILNFPGITIGLLTLGGDDCETAQLILDKRDIERGGKKASDPAYGLAAQLLAAMVNLSAGAETCAAVQTAVLDGQALLVSIGFDGTGDYLKPKGKNPNPDAAIANSLALTLDEYNNGALCQ
jgi:hypothetical protein